MIAARTFDLDEKKELNENWVRIVEGNVTQLHDESIRFGPVIDAYESKLCRTTGGAQDHVSAAGQSATNGHALALEVVKRFRETIWMYILLETDPENLENLRPSNADRFDPKWCTTHWGMVCEAIRRFPKFDAGQLRSRI